MIMLNQYTSFKTNTLIAVHKISIDNKLITWKDLNMEQLLFVIGKSKDQN